MSELPSKIGDELVPPEPPVRLSASELRELAVEVSEGRVYLTNTEEGIQWSFGLMIQLLDFSEIINEVGAFYEEMSKAGPRSINGFPFFTSMKILHREDLPLLHSQIEDYEARKAAFIEEVE
jgi:hypothetical protein